MTCRSRPRPYLTQQINYLLRAISLAACHPKISLHAKLIHPMIATFVGIQSCGRVPTLWISVFIGHDIGGS